MKTTAAQPGVVPSSTHDPVIALPSFLANLSAAEQKARAEELNNNRNLYVYESPKTLPGVAFIKGPVERLPGQMPSRWWLCRSTAAAFTVMVNFSWYNPIKMLRALWLSVRAVLVNRDSTDDLHRIVGTFNQQTSAPHVVDKIREHAMMGKDSKFEETNNSLKLYRKLFTFLQRPKIADVFMEDAIFARLRVAGYNPMSLHRVESLPFDVNDANLPVKGDTLAAAIAEHRLYAQDFSFLREVRPKTNSNNQLYVTKSLFVVPPGGGALQPVGIELDGEVIFPPAMSAPQDTRWAIAKLAVNQNDAVHHELVAHLGKTHLLIEPFVAATMRQLPSSHPLHMLLAPHFEGTVFINDEASRGMLAPGGEIDIVFAGDISAMTEWCAERVINNRFNESMPYTELRARGLMDPILDMPYRDDALEHFDAMYEWVNAYLKVFYKSDADVCADTELRAWVTELVDPQRGRLRDFGNQGSGKIETLKYLTKAITFVIFSASVQHAAVNFPQLEYMVYPPAVPGGLWGELPAFADDASMGDWERLLTPMSVAVEHVKILAVIGAVRYTRLATYRSGELPNCKPIRDALRTYKGRLQLIDEKIRKRERSSRLKYEFMRPSNIPQSINI